MNRARRRGEVLGNTGAMLAGRLLVAGLGWAGTLLVTRSLSTAAFGRFSLVFSILGMLSIVTEMGTGRVALSAMAAGGEGGATGVGDGVDRATFAGAYLVLRSLMGLAGYASALAFVVAMGYPADVVRTTAVAGLVVVLATPAHALHLVFQSSLRMGWVAVAEVFGQLAQLAFTVALVVRGGTLTLFALPAVLAQAVILTLLVPKARRLVPFRLAVLPGVWRALLREALPISIGTAMATLYYRVDAVMLSRLADDEAVAVYGVAYKFVDLAHFVVVAVSVPILAVLVRTWPGDRAGFRDAMATGVTVLATAAVALLVEVLLFAPQAVGLLYGERYRASAGALRILLVAECIAWFGSLSFAVLLATGRHGRYPLVTAAGLVVNVALGLVVIPRWSWTGAAVATVVTEVLVTVPLCLLARRAAPVGPLPLARLARLVPVGLAAAAVGVATRAVLPWTVAAALTAVALAGGVHVSRATGRRGLRSLPGGAA